jgi:hypothetical protein
LMLDRTPERLNHRVGIANIDLRENSVQAGSTVLLTFSMPEST